MKKYSVVYCVKSGRTPIWKEEIIEAEGLYEVSEIFFEKAEKEGFYPSLKQVVFRHAECCGNCGQ